MPETTTMIAWPFYDASRQGHREGEQQQRQDKAFHNAAPGFLPDENRRFDFRQYAAYTITKW
jgi:hypothetical protein